MSEKLSTIFLIILCTIPLSASAAKGGKGGSGGGSSSLPACTTDGEIARFNGSDWQCVDESTLGTGADTLSTFSCNDGEVAKYSSSSTSAWECAPDQNSGSGLSHIVIDDDGKTVGIFENMISPNETLVSVSVLGNNYLLSLTPSGFSPYPTINTKPTGRSRRPFIMYFSMSGCAGDRYTHSGNFTSSQFGGFGSHFEEEYIVFEKGGNSELIAPNTTSISTIPGPSVGSFYYAGECWSGSLTGMYLNDFNDLPDDLLTICDPTVFHHSIV